MSKKQEKVMASIWCRGPMMPWSLLNGEERIAIVFRGSGEKTGTALFADISSKFGECGIQNAELDMSNLDDVWPYMCPVCGTDVNWDMEGFYKTYPHYKGPDLEDE